MRIRVLMLAVILGSLASGLVAMLAPQEAEAIPAFSRQTGESCSTCHTAFPKLNQTGQNFRTNGFRFPEDKEWHDIQDMKHVPISGEVEVEAEFTKERGVGAGGQETLLKIDEVALLAGAPIGKEGRVSAYGVLDFAQGNVNVGQAYGQVNDLAGATGQGLLNVKVGQFDVALPFLSHSQRVIKQRYFAQEALGILGARRNGGSTEAEAPEVYSTGVELNGHLIQKELLGGITHRYAIGIFQPKSLGGINHLGFPGLYATYSIHFLERFTLGAIYKRDVVNSELDPLIPTGKKGVDKWGIAGEVKLGPFIATAGYFRSDGLPATGNGSLTSATYNRALQNYMAEVLFIPHDIPFIPNKKFVLGGRFDHIDQELAQSSSRTTVMGRYYIAPSVYLQGEWRVHDGGGVAGASSQDSYAARGFLVALY
ncbi:MAG: hypothetical protein WBK08_11495 [Nitrospira sp.]|nr:MAG: hypothetical protein E8D42_07110 [Nitrospira sp.]